MHSLRREKIMDHLIEMGGSNFFKNEDEREVKCTTDLGGLGSYVYDEEGWGRVAEEDQKYPFNAVVCIDCKVDAKDPQKHSHEKVTGNKDVDGGRTHSPGAMAISRLPIPSYRSASKFCLVCMAFRLDFLYSGNRKRKCDADRHNKEQHMLNGNIHIDKDDTTWEEQLLEQLIALSRNLPTFPEKPHASICQMQIDATNMIPLDYYTDSKNPPEAFPSADGTLHTPVFYAGDHNKKLCKYDCDCGDSDDYWSDSDDDAIWHGAANYADIVHIAKCISINNQREERVARLYSFGGPGEEGPHGAWGCVPDNLFEDTGWQAIGISHGSSHGSLVLSELGKHYVHELTKPRLSRDLPPLVDALVQHLDKKADWRMLGLRIALYDDLREPRITQPTGVDHVIARKDFYRRDNIRRSELSGFCAAFVDFTVIEEAFRTEKKIVCLGRKEWSMDRCIVIGLPIDRSQPTAGLEMWILSHLPFPLLEVAETFDLQAFSDGEKRDKCYVTYLRNSGLISIPERSTNILFVVPTPSVTDVHIGGALFPVYSKIRTFPKHFAYIYNFDNNIDTILKSAMRCETTLRSSFSTFAKTYFNTGCNWLEIDQIVSGITTRWPKRAEGEWSRTGRKVWVSGLSCSETGFLKENLNSSPVYDADKDVPLLQRYLWANELVNSWDQMVSSRWRAEWYPCLKIGGWNLTAELLLVSGIALYVTENVEDEVLVEARAKNSGHERLKRGGIQRYIVEEWKSWVGLQEQLARAWKDFALTFEIITDGPCPNGQLGAKALLERIVGQHLGWCWEINRYCQSGNLSFTGIRTSSSWWGSKVSREWKKTDLGEITGDGYVMSHYWMHWADSRVTEKGRDPEKLLKVLRRHLMKVDWLRWGAHLEYRGRIPYDFLCESPLDEPFYEEYPGVRFRLSTNRTKSLYTKAGWYNEVSGGSEFTWGWGAPTYYLGCWEDNVLIIMLDRPLAEGLASPVIADGFWLSCGPGAPTVSSNEEPSVFMPEKLQFA